MVIVAVYLLLEHRIHIMGNLQYVLFAAFIGLHFLMHTGHGEHKDHREQTDHSNHKRGDIK
jgi:hypothetical protein